MGVPGDVACINCTFAYTMKRNPSKAGGTKTDAHVEDQRRLESRFYVRRYREYSGGNSSAPTEQLQSLRAVLSGGAYRKWDF